jgi:hypothetical protein
LGNSTASQVAELLLDAGHRPAVSQVRTTPDAVSSAMDRAATAYLQSPEGRRLLAEKCNELASQAACEWLASSIGQDAVKKAKAAGLANTLTKDGDVFESACARAVSEEVARWLKSPLGQAHVEAKKVEACKRAIEQSVDSARGSMPKKSWLDT